MHTTTYTIPPHDEALEALIEGPVHISPRRGHERRQRIPSARERAARARYLLAKCACA